MCDLCCYDGKWFASSLNVTVSNRAFLLLFKHGIMLAAQIARLFLGSSVDLNASILSRTTLLHNTDQPALLVQSKITCTSKSFFTGVRSG